MERIQLIVSSNPTVEDNPADFIARVAVPLELKGRWRCKLECLHASVIQPAKTQPKDILTPFFICVDIVEESEINGTLLPIVGMFSIDGWKPNYKTETYKKCHVSFDEHYHPVTKSYVNRIRIRILDRTLNLPKVNDKDIFTDISTVKLTFVQDG